MSQSPTGFALLDLMTNKSVWRGALPARVEVRDSEDRVTVRADFDKVGLVVPDDISPTHKMVPCFTIDPNTNNYIPGEETEYFDGENVIVDPHWRAP